MMVIKILPVTSCFVGVTQSKHFQMQIILNEKHNHNMAKNFVPTEHHLKTPTIITPSETFVCSMITKSISIECDHLSSDPTRPSP